MVIEEEEDEDEKEKLEELKNIQDQVFLDLYGIKLIDFIKLQDLIAQLQK